MPNAYHVLRGSVLILYLAQYFFNRKFLCPNPFRINRKGFLLNNTRRSEPLDHFTSETWNE